MSVVNAHTTVAPMEETVPAEASTLPVSDKPVMLSFKGGISANKPSVAAARTSFQQFYYKHWYHFFSRLFKDPVQVLLDQSRQVPLVLPRTIQTPLIPRNMSHRRGPPQKLRKARPKSSYHSKMQLMRLSRPSSFSFQESCTFDR
jgi:hypothetical protein